MGQDRSRIDAAITAEAIAVLHRAQRELPGAATSGWSSAGACDVVELAAERLAALGRLSHADALRRALLDWRDRLSSHVLAARALDEIGLHDDVAAHLLERGIVDVLAELSELEPATAS